MLNPELAEGVEASSTIIAHVLRDGKKINGQTSFGFGSTDTPVCES
jgi:hypothetical protein